MVNLVTRMVSMEIVWRQCGEGYFYGDFMVNKSRDCLGFLWRGHGKSSYQTISILFLL